MFGRLTFVPALGMQWRPVNATNKRADGVGRTALVVPDLVTLLGAGRFSLVDKQNVKENVGGYQAVYVCP